LFLHEHPGWTWRDLQETPYEIVELIRMIGHETETIRAARANKGPIGGIR